MSNFEQVQVRPIAAVVFQFEQCGGSKTMLTSNTIQPQEFDWETTSDIDQDRVLKISEALSLLATDRH